MARAIESGVPPRGPQPVRDDGATVELDDDLARTLCKFAGDGVEQRTAEQTAVAMIAAARGYHRREDKPFWWGHFDRRQQPGRRMGRQQRRLHRRDGRDRHRLAHAAQGAQAAAAGAAASESIATGELSKTMYALYEPPSPAGLADDPDRRAFGTVTVVDCDDPDAPTEVAIVERAAQGRRRLRPAAVRADAGTADQHQAAAGLHRGDRGRHRGGPARPAADAVIDILLRRPPRTVSGGAAPPQRRRSPTTSPQRCSTSTRPTSRCTGRPAPARPSPRPR